MWGGLFGRRYLSWGRRESTCLPSQVSGSSDYTICTGTKLQVKKSLQNFTTSCRLFQKNILFFFLGGGE